MKRPGAPAKYVAVAAVSLRQSLAARAPVVARLGFFYVLMLIFSRLWVAVGPRAGIGAVELVWYLALTELVVLSTPFLALTIEEEVQRGDVAYRISQPVSYLWIKVADSMGDMTVRFASLATFGFLGAWLFAGGLPADPRGVLAALPIAYLAAGVMILIQATVGMSAFWLQQSTPLHWIVQKFLFVLGGLMFPLEIYPEWLRAIAMATPFSALLHGPARLAFGFDAAIAAWTLLRVVAWGALIAALAAWVHRRALRVVNVGGG